MLNTLKLRNRILAGYSVPILLSLLVGGFVFITVETVKSKRETADVSHQIVNDAKDIELAVARMEGFARDYIITKSDVAKSQYQESKDNFLKLGEELKSEIKDEEQKATLLTIIDHVNEIDGLNQKVMGLVSQGKATEAAALWTKSGQASAIKLEEELHEFEQQEEEILEEQEKAAHDALNSLIGIVVGGTLMSETLRNKSCV